MILDEPTNHLDIDTRSALVQALNAYNGAVIVISHDRHLIEATVDRLWIVRDGTVQAYDGDMESYRKELLKAGKSPKSGIEVESKDEVAAPVEKKPKQRVITSEVRKRFAPLRKEISALEREIESHKQTLESLDQQLADPDLFVKDPNKGALLSKRRSDTDTAIAEIEEAWLLKSEEYEEAIANA